MTKKIISLLLIFTFLLVPFDTFGAEEATADLTAAVEQSEAYKVLSVLGIISSGDYTTGAFSRQQFVDLTAKTIGMTNSTDTQYFADVEAGNIANTFAKLGYLKVGEDRKFRPNDFITQEEACIILVRVLGYEKYITALGGTSSEYLRIARRLDITIEKQITDQVNFLDAVELLFNALEADVYETVGFSNDGVEYSQTMTLMKRNFDVSVIEGTFYANEWLSPYKDVQCPGDNRIVVGNVVLNSENSEISRAQLWGRNVRVYARGIDGENIPTALLLISDDENMEIYSFDSSDVASVSSDSVKFYENEKIKTVTLSTPTLIYNGDVDFETGRVEILGMMDNYNAEITIVKSEESSSNNAIVIIDEYTNAEVTGVDLVNGCIYARDAVGKNYTIHSEESDGVDRFYIENMNYNTEQAIDNLYRGSIITFAISKSGRVATVYHCTNAIKGKVTGIGTRSGDNYVVIDDTQYKVSENPVGGKLNLNMTATFYFGRNDEIIAISDINNGWQFGYVYRTGSQNDAFNGTQYRYEVYSSESTLNVLKCAEKYILDGVTKTDSKAFYDRLTQNSGMVDDRLRLFRYKLNAAGELKEIDTAALLGESPETEKSLRVLGDRLTRRFRKDADSGMMRFDAVITGSGASTAPASGENRIYGYPLNMSTEVFVVPNKNTDEAIEQNFKHYTMETATIMTNNQEINCSFYNTDINLDFVETMIYYRTSERNYSPKTTPYLINDVGIKMLNSEGDVCEAIQLITTVATSGNELTSTMPLASNVIFTDVKGNKSTCTDSEVTAQLSAGDVIQYGTNNLNQISGLRIVYDFDADDPNTTEDDNRGQVFWGWIDEFGNKLDTYTYRYTNATEDTNLNNDFVGAYGYLLDSVVNAFAEEIQDPYGSTAASSYVFLGAIGTEGSNKVYGTSGYATSYYRTTMFDNARRQHKAYYGIFTDLVNYKSSQDEYTHVLMMNGNSAQRGYCVVFYKR